MPARLKVGRNANSFVSHRDTRDVLAATFDAHPNLTARAVRICMLGRIDDQFRHDHREAYRTVRREEDGIRPLKPNVAVRVSSCRSRQISDKYPASSIFSMCGLR
jgi:hypothetical protein